MANSRKDSKGRVLRPGESERKDGYYIYQYKDVNNIRRVIYEKDLVKLRKREKSINMDLGNGIDTYAGESTTLNSAFDRYIAGKSNLKQSTRTNYKYMYNNYVRPTFGNRRLADIKYSDVKAFYQYLIDVKKFKPNSMEIINTILHPVFSMAHRDGLIRINPSEGIMAEIKKSNIWEKPQRHALTWEQQKAFMKYTAESPIYNHWLPLFVTLLGTGCRIGEVIGLRWEDVDFEERIITIDHTLLYRIQESGKCEFHITTPKTKKGIRTIPMFDEVYEALRQEEEQQKETGFNEAVIDGYSGFIFTNREHFVHNPMTINRAIRRIYEAYNEEEKERARQEKRKPVLIPHFSCHHLRHTFCTRFCENESNIKIIQEIMGHADVTTTMNIYAEATEVKKKQSFANLQGKVLIS